MKSYTHILRSNLNRNKEKDTKEIYKEGRKLNKKAYYLKSHITTRNQVNEYNQILNLISETNQRNANQYM